MRKPPRVLLFGLFATLLVAPPLHSQAGTNAPATNSQVSDPARAQAPGDATSKISALVHAGKYLEAEKLTEALLIVYPDDHRLIKAKALIETLLAPASSTSAAPGNTQPAAPATNTNAEKQVDSPTILPASSQPSSQPTSLAAPATATLHFYRLSHMAGAFSQYNIEIDGRRMAKIANAQSVRIDLPPGKHNINATYRAVKSDRPVYDLEIESGKEYWIRVDLTSGLVTHMRLAVVPEADAREEFGKLQEIAPGDRPGK